MCITAPSTGLSENPDMYNRNPCTIKRRMRRNLGVCKLICFEITQSRARSMFFYNEDCFLASCITAYKCHPRSQSPNCISVDSYQGVYISTFRLSQAQVQNQS